jgi:hypothetical protein
MIVTEDMKENIQAYFKVIFQYLLKKLSKIMKNLSGYECGTSQI